MEYMFQSGFLGTKAPFYMDITVVFLTLLPFLIALTIFLAIKEFYKLHKFFQTIIFIATIIIFGYFEYGIQISGGFDYYIKNSSINRDLALYFLLFHISIAVITLIIWFSIIKYASADNKRRALPGLYSPNHKKSGRVVFVFIILTSITGGILYWILFMT